MTEKARIYNEEKTVSSTSGARKTGKPHETKIKKDLDSYMHENVSDPYLTLYTKINSKWI